MASNNQIGRPESGFKLNPLYFPDGVHIQTHIDYIKSVFVAAFPMYGPMPYILETAIYNVYRNKGWNIVTSESIRKTKEYPTIEDLFYEIDDATEMAGYSKDLQSDVKGALKVRISSLMVGAKGATLNCTESTDFGTIINKPTVVNLESIGDAQEKIFIMGLILTSIVCNYNRMLRVTKKCANGKKLVFEIENLPFEVLTFIKPYAILKKRMFVGILLISNNLILLSHKVMIMPQKVYAKA